MILYVASVLLLTLASAGEENVRDMTCACVIQLFLGRIPNPPPPQFSGATYSILTTTGAGNRRVAAAHRRAGGRKGLPASGESKLSVASKCLADMMDGGGGVSMPLHFKSFIAFWLLQTEMSAMQAVIAEMAKYYAMHARTSAQNTILVHRHRCINHTHKIVHQCP